MNKPSIDDLLRKNDEVATKNSEREKAIADEELRKSVIIQQGHAAIKRLRARINTVVDDFNKRSNSGAIRVGGTDGRWTYTMPNDTGSLTLSSHIAFEPVAVKDKPCRVMAVLESSRGQSIHFLLFGDTTDASEHEWVAVRVTQSPLSGSAPTVQPFGVKLTDIARSIRALDVIVSEMDADVDGAVREMMGYALGL